MLALTPVNLNAVAGEEQGFRWDEPQFGIDWPLPVSVISDRDASWPVLSSVGRVAS